MQKKTVQLLSDLWTAVAKEKLKFESGDLPPAPKEETYLPDGLNEEDFGFIVASIKEIKKPKNYLCIINKGKVIAKDEMPIFFNKQLKDYCRNVAYEMEGSYPFKFTFIRRADKVLKGLSHLGFTPEHKVAIFTLKEKGKDNINHIEKEQSMNKIRSIEIIYADGRRVTKLKPDTEALDEISESIKSEIMLSQEPQIDTHIVYKRDYFKAAPTNIHSALLTIDDFYKNMRIRLKKPLEVSYMVVNADEPYADRILREILIGESIKLNIRKGTDEDKDSPDTDTQAGGRPESNINNDSTEQDEQRNGEPDSSTPPLNLE